MSKHDVSRKILASLLVSPKYSDLTMVCHGQEFRVHRAVVCPQSPVLAAACDGNFEVSVSHRNHRLQYSLMDRKQTVGSLL